MQSVNLINNVKGLFKVYQDQDLVALWPLGPWRSNYSHTHISKHIEVKDQMQLKSTQWGMECNQCYFAFIQAGNLRPFECSQWREAKNVTGVTLHLLRQTI